MIPYDMILVHLGLHYMLMALDPEPLEAEKAARS